MKAWQCGDKVVFRSREDAIRYSVQYGLAANEQQAGLGLLYVELSNEDRFVVMGTFGSMLVFRRIE